jgi:hypothetical protein
MTSVRGKYPYTGSRFHYEVKERAGCRNEAALNRRAAESVLQPPGD